MTYQELSKDDVLQTGDEAGTQSGDWHTVKPYWYGATVDEFMEYCGDLYKKCRRTTKGGE